MCHEAKLWPETFPSARHRVAVRLRRPLFLSLPLHLSAFLFFTTVFSCSAFAPFHPNHHLLFHADTVLLRCFLTSDVAFVALKARRLAGLHYMCTFLCVLMNLLHLFPLKSPLLHENPHLHDLKNPPAQTWLSLFKTSFLHFGSYLPK